MFVIVASLAFNAQSTVSAAGSTYYVDPAGSNGNSGTSTLNPWKNFTNINVMTLQPGDKVLLKRGGVWSQPLIIEGKGTADNFIEVGAYGSGPKPKICSDAAMNSESFIAFRPMTIRNASYLKVSSLEVCNGGAGIVLFYDRDQANNRSVYLDDIVGHDFYGIYRGEGSWSSGTNADDPAIHPWDCDPGPFQPMTAWRDYIAPDRVAFSYGIGITGEPRQDDNRVLTDFRLTNSEIYKTGAGFAVDWFDGEGIRANTVGQVLVDNVYLHDNDVPSVSLASIFLKECTNCVISNTLIDRGACTAPFGTSAIFLGGQNGLLIDNVTIKNTPLSPSWSSDQMAIDFEGGNRNVTIQNSWFERNAGPGLTFYNNGGISTNIEVKNTAFIENSWGNAHQNYTQNDMGQIEISDWPQANRPTGSIHDNWYVNWCGLDIWGNPTCAVFVSGKGDMSGMEFYNNTEGMPPITPTPSPTPTQTPTPSGTFGDVPTDHIYYDEIEALYQAGYTAGCQAEPLLFCPEATMNRAESAVFVQRGIHGAGVIPTDPTSQIFADLALDSWAAKWATGLYDDGFTAGCGEGPLVYCPWQGHTRTEGTVFYLRMLNGADYLPPEPVGVFADVALDFWGADWIEAAYEAGLVPACGENPLRFCPDDPLTRAMAAYMMVQAKDLLQ